ncbi:transglutaminase domain-containing protein, partial [Litorivivens sp.]|uniref:transglutaminase-like domain-containing protein n=1 Tax=Litorivivens sp. TaxID=2020868 RepID=UPI0035642C2A
MNGLALDVFRNGMAAKGTSLFTICMFTFVFYLSPTGAAVANEGEKGDKKSRHIEQQLESTPEKKLTHRLQKLQEKLARELPESRAQREQSRSWLERMLEKLGLGGGPLKADELAELSDLTDNVREAYAEAIALLEQEDKTFRKSKKLPPSAKTLVAERHEKALNAIKLKHQKVDEKLRTLTASDNAEEQRDLLTQLAEEISNEQFAPTHTPVDPANLPWRSPSEKVRVPEVEKGQLQLVLGVDSLAGYPRIASTSLTPELLNPLGQPVEADLAETIDATITEEIKALAASLNNNPVEIYTWVHNNIRFIPSYGSIQGAQYTLETGKGNAVDTSSLLIALLRAAGIPARYAYGTVEIPVDRVMNWVGGVTKPEAAQSLLGQGGIPNIALIRGGAIHSIRMEHTWVEAWVDFEPSRGLKNREGDRWIPMDASFKQYAFTEGMNLADAVPFDAEGLAAKIQQSATVNEEQGWVQNVPQAAIENSLQQFQNQLEDYINNQNPEATVGEVLGLKAVKVLPPRPLAAGLPYEHIVTQQS